MVANREKRDGERPSSGPGPWWPRSATLRRACCLICILDAVALAVEPPADYPAHGFSSVIRLGQGLMGTVMSWSSPLYGVSAMSSLSELEDDHLRPLC